MLWWKEYAREWKRNLFLVIQMVVMLFFVNSEVSSLEQRYASLTYVTGTDSNLYFYENAMGTLTDDWGYRGFCHAVEKLGELDGLEEIAWQARVNCVVEGYEREGFSDDVSHINLSPAFWKGLQYRLEEGRWFLGQDAEDDVLQVIIGGGLSKKYKTGDTLTLDYEEEEGKEALVIGSLGEDFYMLGDSSAGISERDLSSYVSCEEDVILSNDMEWFSRFQEQAVYPALSVMVKVREGADLSEYERYGVLTSFGKVMENTRKKCRNFIWDAIVFDEAIWIFVIVFGVLGVSYATAKSMRYTWGIYSLLGMTGNRLLGRLLLQNILTYLIGGIAANIFAPYIAHFLNYYYEITTAGVMATGGLIVVLLLISYFCNRYIRSIKPKEILMDISV